MHSKDSGRPGPSPVRRSRRNSLLSLARACGLPKSLTVGDIAQNMLMIVLQDFMDLWIFNQKNLMKCCKEFLLPGGKQVPFCAYNTIGYREQARAQLEAMEPKHRWARREGLPYQVEPVVFDFKARTPHTETVALQQIHANGPH